MVSKRASQSTPGQAVACGALILCDPACLDIHDPRGCAQAIPLAGADDLYHCRPLLDGRHERPLHKGHLLDTLHVLWHQEVGALLRKREGAKVCQSACRHDACAGQRRSDCLPPSQGGVSGAGGGGGGVLLVKEGTEVEALPVLEASMVQALLVKEAYTV